MGGVYRKVGQQLVAMRSPTGVLVDVSERVAERLWDTSGFKYLAAPESPSEATTEPVKLTPAPKRRGRPRKVDTNG